MRTFLAFAFAIVVCGVPRELTTATAQETVVIRGRVVADDQMTPLPRVRISIGDSSAVTSSALSDEGGAFEIVAPAAGTGFMLRAARTGFVTASVPYTNRRAADPIEIRLVRVAVLSGRVTGPTGAPVAGMGIRIRGVGSVSAVPASDLRAASNDLGEFRLSGLAEGRYVLSAYRDFDELARWQRDDAAGELRVPTGPAITGVPATLSDEVAVDVAHGRDSSVLLVSNEAAAIALRYARTGGAIAGLVLDESGDPVEGAKVRLWQTRLVEGRTFARQFGPSRTTDEQGRYRLFHIPPGSYLVEVVTGSADQARARPSAPLFYPGTRWVDRAVQVHVGSRQEQASVDIVLSDQQPAAVRVFGSVVNAAGAPQPGGALRMVNVAPPGGVTLPARSAKVEQDGTFEFPDVAPGEYVLKATIPGNGPGRPPASQFGLRYISVSEPGAGPFRLEASPAATLSGRVVFEGRRPDAPPAQFQIALRHADPLTAPDVGPVLSGSGLSFPQMARVHDDWSFEISGVTGPVRLTLDSGPVGWWVKSVNTPVPNKIEEPISPETSGDLTIVLSNTGAMLSGRVFTQSGQPIFDDVVVKTFPVDEDRWYDGSPDLRLTARLGDDQRFNLIVPPGEYYVVAVSSVESLEASANIEQLRALSMIALRVTVVAGQTMRMDLPFEEVP